MAYPLLPFRRMSQLEITGHSTRLEGFDYPTLEEIVSLWQSYKASGLAPEEAWDAIAAGLALDLVFSGHGRAKNIEQ
jgi:hypothetical protein